MRRPLGFGRPEEETHILSSSKEPACQSCFFLSSLLSSVVPGQFNTTISINMLPDVALVTPHTISSLLKVGLPHLGTIDIWARQLLNSNYSSIPGFDLC